MALSPKTYIGKKTDGSCKVSTKGVQKTNKYSFDDFLSVLQAKSIKRGTNRGFVRGNKHIKQYVQHKNALTFFYAKRKILPDLVSTVPLDI